MTEQPGALLQTGDHCRFCDAKPICPELRDKSLARVKDLFADETLTAPSATPPTPGELSPSEMGRLLEAFPTIEQWIKAVREHAYNEARRGATPPGFKLVEKSANRKWKDAESAAWVLSSLVEDPDAIYTPPKLKTPAQMEKALPKPLRGAVSSLCEKPRGGTALVPASDNRPAITVGDVFEDLPSENESEMNEDLF